MYTYIYIFTYKYLHARYIFEFSIFIVLLYAVLHIVQLAFSSGSLRDFHLKVGAFLFIFFQFASWCLLIHLLRAVGREIKDQ